MANLTKFLRNANRHQGAHVALYLFLSGVLIALPALYFISIRLESQQVAGEYIDIAAIHSEVLTIFSVLLFLLIAILSLLVCLFISRWNQASVKDEVFSNISHKVRTSLTAILGFSESLLDSDQSMDERVTSINTVIRNTRELLKVIDDDIMNKASYFHSEDHALSVSKNNTSSTNSYKGSVLLVEDNVDNQKLFEMYLIKIGAEVHLAKTGDEAVEMLLKSSFDLVLMDMLMPGLSGVEATKLIRKNGYSQPVVMITANILEEELEKCRGVGIDDFITKPVSRNHFVEFVGQFLQPVSVSESAVEPVVSELASEGPEFFNIVKAYVKQLPEDLKDVIAAFDSNDLQKLKRKIHSMKGTSGNMGFLDYSKLCGQVEFAITKDDQNDIQKLLQTLEEMKQRIIAGISAD